MLKRKNNIKTNMQGKISNKTYYGKMTKTNMKNK